MTADIKRVLVLIKQVPDQNAKAGINPDGTIDRARAKRMMNPFDRYALQAALDLKSQTGCEVFALSMGPPNAEEVLLEAIEYGADGAFLLSDRRLAASDTLATAYALHKLIKHVETTGKISVICCGLQTTDGDTAQVGPQIAERLNLPQVSYCEEFKLTPSHVEARRVVEGGYQWVKTQLPCLLTVANSYPHLKYRKFKNAFKVRQLIRNPELKASIVKIVDLDAIGADPVLCGLKGSPTIVAKTDKVGELGGSCVVHQGQPVTTMVKDILNQTSIKEFAL